ncbi:hypothetical protein [Sedimentibacter sp.]|uniref:hypothetical protein n=1 Tax=Sedimentibacter sp. TaxID=1960295 RepID=UPI0028AD56A9|nr:hypothetical protein [Sedimentibacter sp.]
MEQKMHDFARFFLQKILMQKLIFRFRRKNDVKNAFQQKRYYHKSITEKIELENQSAKSVL